MTNDKTTEKPFFSAPKTRGFFRKESPNAAQTEQSQPSAAEPATSAKPTAEINGAANSHAKERAGAEAALPQQPDKAGNESGDKPGWNIGGAPTPAWGSLDLGGGSGTLPADGNYDGTVSDLKISESFSAGSEKPDVLWMIVEFGLDGQEATPGPRIEMLDSHRGPVDQHRKIQGRRFLNRLAAATGTPLEKIGDPFELPDLFVGKKLNLTIRQKMRDGVAELVVGNGVRPRLK